MKQCDLTTLPNQPAPRTRNNHRIHNKLRIVKYSENLASKTATKSEITEKEEATTRLRKANCKMACVRYLRAAVTVAV